MFKARLSVHRVVQVTYIDHPSVNVLSATDPMDLDSNLVFRENIFLI
jgi:hypothetical protein